MTRKIEISTDVFAAIWAQRKDGEESENDILFRLLDCRSDTVPPNFVMTLESGFSPSGYYDARNDVHFPEGFIAFRQYKGAPYGAKATKGQWLRSDNNVLYPSLNKLNESITAGPENIWNGSWQYIDNDNVQKSIEHLRQ